MTLTAMMVVLFAFQSQAQLRFGARAGLNMANLSITTPGSAPTLSNIYSFHLGGVAEYSLSDVFALEGGLQISGKGAKQENTTAVSSATVISTNSTNPIYLEIPINAVYSLNLGSMNLNLFAGPYLSFGIAGSDESNYSVSGTLPAGVSFKDETTTIKYGSDLMSDYSSTDFGLNIGAGIEVSKFQARLQYGLGLTGIEPISISGFSIKNRVLSLGVGYMFGDKK